MNPIQYQLFEAPKAQESPAPEPPETWADFPGAPGYRVSSLGRFQNPKGKLFSGNANHNGYIHIGPRVDGKQKVQLAHRVVAAAFHPQPAGLNLVNHKNRNRHDNRASNLEWSNASLNTLHWRREAA